MGEQDFLGVDVSKKTLDLCLLNEQRKRYLQVSNAPGGFQQLRSWLSQCGVGTLRVCLEATGLYGEELAEFLYEDGHEVAVVNPARIRAYAASQLTRNKTDRVDAALIADFCRTQKVTLWSPPPAERRELRELVRLRHALIGMRQQQRNRLAAGGRSETVSGMLQQHLAYLQSQIDRLDEQIQEHIAQHPLLKRRHDLLVSIPGIGQITAAVLLGEIGDFLSFGDVRQLVAYAGLNPRHHRSGSSVRGPSHIAKTGNAHIRDALYWPAVTALRHNPLIKPLCERIIGEGKPRMVAVVAAMRKLLHLAYGVIKNDKPFDPDHLSTSPSVI